MNQRKEEIFDHLVSHSEGLTAAQTAEILHIDRSNASRYLSELFKEGRIKKGEGRPVIYYASLMPEEKTANSKVTFADLVGMTGSLKISIQQAKAAVLYPPKGLHTIIFGESGTGKSMFAECMYQFAIDSHSLNKEAPFVSFNCADYAQNPQLLFGQIFGVKKGAFTGATEDRPGLIAKADGGILFLDEIHRLPPEGQEMLFSFIDKGVYRPLGESSQVYEASVQILGATTESSEILLETFNRRIPMMITLPSLDSRPLDERFEVISLFIKQEVNRLNQSIDIQKEAVVAFMLYDAPANIGQIKRDLKLVCAKAFLHYRTQDKEGLVIHKNDCPLQVQKGLLKMKQMSERLDHFLEGKGDYLHFEPGDSEMVWAKDPEQSMQVYNEIEEKVSDLQETGVATVDLEKLISKDVDAYFETYVEELVQVPVQKEWIPENIWQLTNQLYDQAEKTLNRRYNEKARFAFALHLQSTLDRLKEGHMIVHPNLNRVRKQLKVEFQVAMDLSTIIEDTCQVEVPFDEIGFISMFLSAEIGEIEPLPKNRVNVIVLMHGSNTATSMLETAQDLLDTTTGVAMDMPIDMDVKELYNDLLIYIRSHQEELSNGVLLLTDMGSLNSFAELIDEELGIRIKAITMVSTMIVIEALRLSDSGRSLENIYQNIELAFETIMQGQFKKIDSHEEMKKAVIVTCFTGEGVAAKLYQRILPLVDRSKIEVIPMQFIEPETFKKHIDSLSEEYDIKAIAGTVAIDYQNIPFFSAYDMFDDDKLATLQRLLNDEISLNKIVDSLQDAVSTIESLPELVEMLNKIVQQIQTQLHLMVEPSVQAGIMIHLVFMIESYHKKEKGHHFPNLAEFQHRYRLEIDLVKTSLIVIERDHQIQISDDDVAFITQAFIENKIESSFKSHTKN